MDRRYRHRALLGVVLAGSWVLLALAGSLLAQGPSPAASSPTPTPSAVPTAAATATPWVQASPPPTVSPARVLREKMLAQVPPEIFAASSPKEDPAKTMARKREEELARQSPSPVKPPRTMPQLTPEEKEAYERNLTLWLALPPEERVALRGEATERIREETEKAYQSSGLRLNDDQREVFALRYRQERRRLERELQEKARAERERRMPEIMERLKREFPASSPGANPSKPTAVPTGTATPTPAK